MMLRATVKGPHSPFVFPGAERCRSKLPLLLEQTDQIQCPRPLQRICFPLYEQPGVQAEVLGSESALQQKLHAPTSYKHGSASFDPWQQRILDSDGLLFVVPEYNGSYPGALNIFY